MSKIQTAKIIPSNLKEGRFQAEVEATFEDGTVGVMLSYYDDELRFLEGEFVGLTRGEVGELFTRRDIAYLRS